MVSFTSTREQYPLFFTFPSCEVSPSSPSPSSVFATPSSSAPSTTSPAFSCPPGNTNSCLLQKQRQMRLLVAERLPLLELPFASFVQSDQRKNFMRRSISARPASIAEFGFKTLFSQTLEESTEGEDEEGDMRHRKKKKSRRPYRAFRFRVGNASAKRLLSGAFAGAVSRTAVAPLETIRTHLMVGSAGRTVHDVFNHIMHTEGWQGLFRGNGVNVIRVAPSKAIEAMSNCCCMLKRHNPSACGTTGLLSRLEDLYLVGSSKVHIFKTSPKKRDKRGCCGKYIGRLDYYDPGPGAWTLPQASSI